MRHGLVLALVLVMGAALAMTGGLLRPPAAAAAGARAKSSSSGTISATASTPAAPTIGNAGGLSGFPTPSVATTTSATPTVVNTSTGTAGSSSFSGTSALIIAIGAVVLLGGISYFIWRDARRRAPVSEVRGGLDAEGRARGSKAPPKPRKLSPAERRRRKRGRAKR